MTIKEALEEIYNKQIPKEINGISTKYVINADGTLKIYKKG